MVELNDNAIAYMKRMDFKDIILDAVLYTS